MLGFCMIENINKTESGVIFHIVVQNVPECLAVQAQEIDGGQYFPECFEILVDCERKNGNCRILSGKPRSEICYIDFEGEKHWMEYTLSPEEKMLFTSICRKTMKELEERKEPAAVPERKGR